MIPLRVFKGYLWGLKVYDLLLSIFSMTIYYLFYHCKVFLHTIVFSSRNSQFWEPWKKVLEKPENTIISTSICFVFNSKEFESIQKDSNLESVPRFQPFFYPCRPSFSSLGKWNWLIRFLDGPLPILVSFTSSQKKHMVMRQTGKLDFSWI